VSSGDVVLSGLPSDSHTWNLVYLQLLIEEMGHQVTNLGACVPFDLLLGQCIARRPRLIVLSSVNGHGFTDGGQAARRLRACPALSDTMIVIGGKLGLGVGDTAQRVENLIAAGFDAVFEDTMGIDGFRSLLEFLPTSRVPALPALPALRYTAGRPLLTSDATS
jgi:methylaspartate mutase sigma subunit